MDKANVEGYNITGNLDKEYFEGETVYLSFKTGEPADSAVIKNNAFSFSGKVDSPVYVILGIGDNSYVFVLANDDIQVVTISIDKDVEKWAAKAKGLNSNMVNIHCAQPGEDLSKRFFVSGVPDNILLSQDREIMRKKVNLNELSDMLK